MAFLKHLFGRAAKNKREYPNIRRGTDPLESWTKTRELGDGSFGKVYQAEHRESGRVAALKRVPIQDETELEDFMVEIDILAECRNKYIVELYEAFFYDEALWIFIEFCAGGAVDDIIVELDHGLSEPQIRCISRQMFEGLEFLHEHGCIHRDIKAGNILLVPNGTIRLADFGVSAKPSKEKLKRTTYIGTPYWMAPEVIVCETNKDVPYDCQADIWSGGITMIELAEMNPPHSEMSQMRVVLKIVRSDAPTLAQPRKWSKDFSTFLSRCLQKDPSVRASATELLSHPFIATVTDFRPLRILYQERGAEVEEVVEELPEDADLTLERETQYAECEFTPPGSPTESEASSARGDRAEPPPPLTISEDQKSPTPSGSETASAEILIASPMTPDTEAEGLGPSPTAVSPAHISGVGPLPTEVDSEEEETPLHVGPKLVMVSPEPSSLGPDTIPVSGGLGPQPVVVSPEPASELPEESESTSSGTSTPSQGTHREPRQQVAPQRDELKFATLSRVRKFRVDGHVMQTTTSRIVDAKTKQTLKDNKRYQEMRKQDFRELKRLQREEMKEATEFYNRIRIERDAQEKRFETEKQEVEKRYETELEVMNKRQKKEIEKLEVQHINQFKNRSKTMKNDQAKEAKHYKVTMKEREKQRLKEAESGAAKGQKKATLARMRAELQLERQREDQRFMNMQAEQFEAELKRLLDEQKAEMKAVEMSFLDARQELKRTQLSETWEMEQRHKQDRHQLLKRQVREAFHMQRHQMHVRHQKEIELQARRDQFRVEEVRQRQILEKRQLPKKLKTEHKAAVAELRKAIRQKKVSGDKEQFKKMDEDYVKRSEMETEMMREKHEKEMETLKAELEANLKELQDIQNEKKMSLTQQENNKIKERDEQHTQELRVWRADLAKTKQKLEEEFRRERTEQEVFYTSSHTAVDLMSKSMKDSRSLSVPSRMQMGEQSIGAASAISPSPKDQRAAKAKSVSLEQLSSQARSSPVKLDVDGSKASHRISLQPIDEVVLASPSMANGSNS